jgi:hypothetical protein
MPVTILGDSNFPAILILRASYYLVCFFFGFLLWKAGVEAKMLGTR